MSERSFETQINAIGTNGYVTADEVLFLRRSVFANGIVETSELDAVFTLANRAPDGDAEWTQFFAEVTADFYLREEEPQGYLTNEEFTSLKKRIINNDGQANGLECALLVKLMETATQTTPAMAEFTAEQIKQAILRKPNGPVVDKSDAMILRRYLFAAGGDGNVAVTRNEAELLFDINDAVQSAPNNPAWTELFVQGVTSHLMAHLGYTAPSREEAFRRNAWARDHSINIGSFFKRMLSGGLGAIGDAYAQDSVQTTHNDKRDKDVKLAAKVTQTEADWLAKRIGRDGILDDNERRLIDRMQELENELPENLKALLERVA